MSFLGVLMIILAVLCCSSQVQSDQAVFIRNIQFSDKQLIIGKNHIDGMALTYALCETDPYQQTATCAVYFHRNAINKSKSEVPCPVQISTQYQQGKIYLSGVNLWGENKVIFTWWDKENENAKRAMVHVRIFRMDTCNSTGHAFEADDRDGLKKPLFIVTAENRFEIGFVLISKSKMGICRRIINEDDEISEPEIWFPDLGEPFAVEKISNHANQLVVTFGTSDRAELGRVKFYLLSGGVPNELDRSYVMHGYIWSTSNDKITFCTIKVCKKFTYTGAPLNTITLNMQPPINHIIGLYNLPETGHLAVVCDNEPDSNYRFIRIGQFGQLLFSLPIKGLKCLKSKEYDTVKFFRIAETEYCVILFYSEIGNYGYASIRMYCSEFHQMLLE